MSGCAGMSFLKAPSSLKLPFIPLAVLIHCLASLVIGPSVVFLLSDSLVGQWTTNLALLKRGLLNDALRPYTVSVCLSLVSAPALVGVWSGRELIQEHAARSRDVAIVAAIAGLLSIVLYLALITGLRILGTARLTVFASLGFRGTVPFVIALWALAGISIAAGANHAVVTLHGWLGRGRP
jgi:hypothetical protein